MPISPTRQAVFTQMPVLSGTTQWMETVRPMPTVRSTTTIRAHTSSPIHLPIPVVIQQSILTVRLMWSIPHHLWSRLLATPMLRTLHPPPMSIREQTGRTRSMETAPQMQMVPLIKILLEHTKLSTRLLTPVAIRLCRLSEPLVWKIHQLIKVHSSSRTRTWAFPKTRHLFTSSMPQIRTVIY